MRLIPFGLPRLVSRLLSGFRAIGLRLLPLAVRIMPTATCTVFTDRKPAESCGGLGPLGRAVVTDDHRPPVCIPTNVVGSVQCAGRNSAIRHRGASQVDRRSKSGARFR